MNNILKFNKKILLNRKLCSTKLPKPDEGLNIPAIFFGSSIVWLIGHICYVKGQEKLQDYAREQNRLKYYEELKQNRLNHETNQNKRLQGIYVFDTIVYDQISLNAYIYPDWCGD